MTKCKISIITVTYNAEKFIEETIRSVINQTYPNIEYIIIDGGSTDNTLSIINKYQQYIHKLISEPDKGIYDAMNKGIDIATGDWINFMNAGDRFAENNTLELIFDKNYLEYDYIYGDRINKDSVGLFIEKANPFFNQKNKYCPWKGVCHQSTFVRTKTAKIHKYSLQYKYSGDYEMMYNIYKNNGRFLYRPIPVAIYNQVEGFSVSGFREGIIENGKLLGIPNNFKFKVWLKWMCFRDKINRFIKKNLHIRIKKKQLYTPTNWE